MKTNSSYKDLKLWIMLIMIIILNYCYVLALVRNWDIHVVILFILGFYLVLIDIAVSIAIRGFWRVYMDEKKRLKNVK